MDGRRGQKGLYCMNTINELTHGCKRKNLLKYFDLLCKAKPVADIAGLRLIEDELERVKGKYLFFESLRGGCK